MSSSGDVTRMRRAVVVIGAGQAGLSAAHYLRRQGFQPRVDMEVLDANPTPGGAWSHRWDALTFDDAHGIHDLPRFPLGETDPEEPAREVVMRYYDAFERHEQLQVRRPVRVTAVTRHEGGGFVVRAVVGDVIPDARARAGYVSSFRAGPGAGAGEAGGGADAAAYDGVQGEIEIVTDTVISATGTWDKPFVPTYQGRFDGRQLTTRDFVSPDEFAGQRVLVVGGGASAVQFVLLLDDAGVETVWSTRRPMKWVDGRIAPDWGRDVENRVREKTHQGLPPGSVVSNTGMLLTDRYRDGIERGVLVSRGKIERLTPTGVDFVDGSHEDVDAILWATGFRASLGHLAPLKLREHGGGLLVGEDDVTLVREPGLFVVGYGASASTIGATRAGHRAGQAVGRCVRPWGADGAAAGGAAARNAAA